MQKINNELLNSVLAKAKESPRRRMNHNFHTDFSDPINRMLNCFVSDTYFRPHKHENPDKREVFLVLKGSLVVIIFDEVGNIIDHIVLNQANGSFGVEIPPREWHTIVCLEPETVIYELKDGPYMPINDKNFAQWAPAEGEAGCKEIQDKWLKELGLRK
jgi:cupin fold WbuC family metalloprotein